MNIVGKGLTPEPEKKLSSHRVRYLWQNCYYDSLSHIV